MIKAQRDSIRLLQAALVAAIALPIALFVYAAWLGYASTQTIADGQIARTTDVINEHALKVFEAVERTIAEVNEIVREMPDDTVVTNEAQLHERLRRLSDASSQIKSIWIFDRNGFALVNSLSLPAGTTDFSDRDYFKVHVEKDIGTYVGSVLRPRRPFDGAPFFGISRRRFSANGEFTGVIQVSVLPEYFEGFYQKLEHEAGAYASLIREDGLILARFPPIDREARLAQQGPLFQSMLRQPERGRVTLVSAIDGTGRKVSYRKLADFPVFILAGLETTAIRNQWLSQLGGQLIFGFPATAALIGILVLALARTRRLYAEAAGRVAAEAALRQSQRLEALGQLTGGVAHDFNNLLMVIGGSAERARSRSEDAQVSRSLSMIEAAVKKGETLTRRLLSFSRGHTLAPRVIDLGECIASVQDVLRQSLRGNVQLDFKTPDHPLIAKVDPDELEIALLNLTVNARDAMPNGGSIFITLQTARLPDDASSGGLAGDFAVIEIVDTGSGIPAEVKERIFEPYFTTKADKGTGLGLSQVYGFAKHSGGGITVDSEPGKGTAFRLFLPLSTEALSSNKDAVAPAEILQSGGRVLLVEDNPEVAIIAADHLEQCGCTVLRAQTAEAAIEVLGKDKTIALVFSDIVMPGKSGLELGRWTRANRPGIPVVLATGYSEQASVAVSEGFPLLAKPYSFGALREVLARSGMKCQPDQSDTSS
jgi:two-component system NtrC family sensor kinase